MKVVECDHSARACAPRESRWCGPFLRSAPPNTPLEYSNILGGIEQKSSGNTPLGYSNILGGDVPSCLCATGRDALD
jgi:hypothetical protein